ncbi:MAG TPA: hypothetical protein VJ840_17480 [Gemmatimonadaceae bacterium]|nr:hypothetical protein [Gemmatimonadaceae bacterium]
MMVLSSLRPDASIVEYLEQRARAESIRRLVTATLIAIALVVGGLRAAPFGKPVIVTLAFTYFCYGAWGLLDRALSSAGRLGWQTTATFLRMLSAAFVALGVLSGIGVLMAIVFTLLGDPWIL